MNKPQKYYNYIGEDFESADEADFVESTYRFAEVKSGTSSFHLIGGTCVFEIQVLYRQIVDDFNFYFVRVYTLDDTGKLNDPFVCVVSSDYLPVTWIELLKSVSKSLSDFYSKKVGELLLDIVRNKEQG